MEGGVSPLIEVDPWKDAGLARNPRVDLIVRQHHRVYLETVKVSNLLWSQLGDGRTCFCF